MPSPPGRPPNAGGSLRQVLVGLVALPLTAVPFVGYANLTPEGRLVRDRAIVALSPPTLPKLSSQQKAVVLAAAPRYEGAVMALAYHGIGSASDAEGGFVVSPKRFAEHLAVLRAAGMTTVTASDMARAFTGGSPLPPNAVMISFDDGRTDAMMFADPLLKQARMWATMFVIAGAAAEPGVYYASWDRISGYARSGRWDIQSHTNDSHREQKAAGAERLPVLTSRAPRESLAEYRSRVREDLSRASAAIERHVGRPPVALAYPFGAYGADRTNDPAIAGVLREEVARRYALAFHQDDQHTVPLLTPEQDRLGLRRLEVENWSGLELLRRIQKARQGSVPAVRLPPSGAEAEGDVPVSASASRDEPRPGSERAIAGRAPAGAPPATELPSDGNRASAPVLSLASPPSPLATPHPPAPPPATSAPPPPVATIPPTAAPTTSRPPTTAPPSTSPPTTAAPCTVNRSGKKCAPGRS